jgi:hypothetical protein
MKMVEMLVENWVEMRESSMADEMDQLLEF